MLVLSGCGLMFLVGLALFLVGNDVFHDGTNINDSAAQIKIGSGFMLMGLATLIGIVALADLHDLWKTR